MKIKLFRLSIKTHCKRREVSQHSSNNRIGDAPGKYIGYLFCKKRFCKAELTC